MFAVPQTPHSRARSHAVLGGVRTPKASGCQCAVKTVSHHHVGRRGRDPEAVSASRGAEAC